MSRVLYKFYQMKVGGRDRAFLFRIRTSFFLSNNSYNNFSLLCNRKYVVYKVLSTDSKRINKSRNNILYRHTQISKYKQTSTNNVNGPISTVSVTTST